MREIPAEKAAAVAALPRRVAQVTHALIEAHDGFGAPVTPAEVCQYDSTAMSYSSTREALSRALSRGLADRGGGYWFPTNAALELRRALEDRVLAMEDAAATGRETAR